MADSKAKMPNGTTPNAKSTTKGSFQKLNGLISRLSCTNKELTEELAAFGEIDKLVEAKKDLEARLRLRTEELAKLEKNTGARIKQLEAELQKEKSRNEMIWEDVEKRSVVHAESENAKQTQQKQLTKVFEELTSFKQAETRLKSRLATAERERQQFQESLNKSRSEAALASTQLKAKDAEVTALRMTIKSLERDLGEDRLQPLNEKRMATMMGSLEKLFEESMSLVEGFVDTTPGQHQGDVDIRDLSGLFPKLPLLPSQSRHAVEVRRAAALGLIADVLIAAIFRPFYLPKGIDDPIQGLLRHHLGSRQQTIVRCQILAATDFDSSVKRCAARDASNEVHKTLFSLVQGNGAFSENLKRFFESSVEIWSEFQSVEELIVCETVQPGPWSSDEDPPGRYMGLDAGPAVPPPKAGQAMDAHILAMVFPRIVTEGAIIHPGVAVWSDQAHIVAAREELHAVGRVRDANHSPIMGIGPAKRRLSLSNRASSGNK